MKKKKQRKNKLLHHLAFLDPPVLSSFEVTLEVLEDGVPALLVVAVILLLEAAMEQRHLDHIPFLCQGELHYRRIPRPGVLHGELAAGHPAVTYLIGRDFEEFAVVAVYFPAHPGLLGELPGEFVLPSALGVCLRGRRKEAYELFGIGEGRDDFLPRGLDGY